MDLAPLGFCGILYRPRLLSRFISVSHYLAYSPCFKTTSNPYLDVHIAKNGGNAINVSRHFAYEDLQSRAKSAKRLGNPTSMRIRSDALPGWNNRQPLVQGGVLLSVPSDKMQPLTINLCVRHCLATGPYAFQASWHQGNGLGYSYEPCASDEVRRQRKADLSRDHEQTSQERRPHQILPLGRLLMVTSAAKIPSRVGSKSKMRSREYEGAFVRALGRGIQLVP